MISLASIYVLGSDSLPFLQGQVTQDLKHLKSPQSAIEDTFCGLAAICNHKGRVISLVWITKISEQEIILTLPEELALMVKNHLQRYVLRSKVQLEVRSCSEKIIENLPKFPWIPWILQDTSEKYIPQMLNLDCLNAINFKKGCYTGQEIVARTHYLGEIKRRIFLLSHPNADYEWSINEEIYKTDPDNFLSKVSVGKVLLSHGQQALAVLQAINHDQILLNDKNDFITIINLPYEVKHSAI